MITYIEEEEINLSTIVLVWSNWFSWNILKVDARSHNGVKVPNGIPGVYEVKYQDVEELLTIGKTNDLRFRIKQGLIKGKTGHSAGENIRDNEDVSKLVVRWAITDRPAAVEEELHRKYKKNFGKLPKYVQHT